MFNTFFSRLEEEFKKTLIHFETTIQTLRTGRAHISVLDNILVNSYDNMVPLDQVGSLSAPDAQTIAISVWDKSMIAPIMNAIRESDLGLNPTNDSTLIRIPMPRPTEERRLELTKTLDKYAEESRISLRHTRQNFINELKRLEKDKEISEDDRKVSEKEIQSLLEKHSSLIEEKSKEKKTDIMQV
ncbi:MAG: ribosome recycling factor [Alphaproteobacteria bacterium]|nr:ribosome recycling factor [Alphaproteobacteria bacterium]MBL0717837.1 ribosome recycling factor [Alphaproteobacteria bacterium]